MKLMYIIALAFTLASSTCNAQDNRSREEFDRWRTSQKISTGAFEAYLNKEGVGNLVPLHELLRTASLWEQCEEQPFALPPEKNWPYVKSVLKLIEYLRSVNILNKFEVYSAYRNKHLNGCAGGSRKSAHYSTFAIDIGVIGPNMGKSICKFWHTEGKKWKMGLSKYPSGRIHIDTNGYRTWGSDYTWKTSFCMV